jgi:hypothetical protein
MFKVLFGFKSKNEKKKPSESNAGKKKPLKDPNMSK